MKKSLCLLLGLLWSMISSAQLVTEEQPYSFTHHLSLSNDKELSIDRKVMPKVDVNKMEAKERSEGSISGVYRFAEMQKAGYSLKTCGTWQTLPNGDKIWHLSILCPDAKSIYLVYDRFWIPKGGKFFVFTPDHKQYLGAYTSRNCRTESEKDTQYATGLLFGDEVILEYYQPKEVDKDADISIAKVANGYKGQSSYFLGGYGTAASCQVDINCSEGDNWQNEKRAICHILHDGYACTGALVNNTRYDCQPLVLTANHNLNGADAISSPYLNDWLFYWNYENSGCGNSTLVSNYSVHTTGAIIKANNSDTDFALLGLSEDPRDINSFKPYYLGWNSSGNIIAGGVCISHPEGDSKKIASYSMTPQSVSLNGIFGAQNYLKVNFIETDNGFGFPQGGSSGAPLISNSHKVIGQLKSGGSSSSSDFFYGKLSASWNGNGSPDPERRMKDWLDSLNTGLQSLEGYDSDTLNPTFSISGETYLNYINTYTLNNLPNGYSVVWSVNNTSFSIDTFDSSCAITYHGVLDYEEALLTATISINGITIKSLHKPLVHISDIGGSSVICGGEIMTLNIPTTYTVTWSINDGNFYLSSSGNQCTVYSSGSPTNTITGTLCANISINGQLIGTRTKQLYILGSSFNVLGVQEQYDCNSGTYPEQQFVITSSAQTEINGDCNIVLSSDHFLEKEISFVGNYQPLNIVHNNNTVSFTTQSQNSDYTLWLRAQSNSGCTDLNLNFLVTPIPYLNDPELIVSLSGSGNDMLSVHLLSATGGEIGPGVFQEATWTMTIKNLQTGVTMTTQQVYGSSALVYIGNYNTGVYLVTASILINGQLRRYSSRFIKQ